MNFHESINPNFAEFQVFLSLKLVIKELDVKCLLSKNNKV